ncbi:MAG: DUF192 domain-containing protein [Phycisphaerae bacterium]|nr:DUF192 domain-containing protein [Phycisphaerae bacterium]
MIRRKYPTRLPTKRWITPAVFLALAVGVIVAAVKVDTWWPTTKPQPTPQLALYEVRIAQASWQVELAVTEAQQSLGLGRRDELPAGRGMLFVYDKPHVMTFWMKDCLIPLDIAFIDAAGFIVKIHTMPNEPLDTHRDDLKLYSSGVPALLALEVPAGALGQAGVRVGDRVTLDPNIPLPGRTP